MNDRIAHKMLKQKAVYWGAPTNDGYGGYNYPAPVEIDCKWSDKQEKFVDRNAEEHISKAIIIIDHDVTVGGQIALVELADLSSSMLPGSEDAHEIKAFLKTADFKGTAFQRKAWLRK